MALHPVDVHVGKRLRMRRTILGLSQESIASSVGVTCQQVQKYESGANRMPISRLYEFSKLLGTPITFFFDEYELARKADNSNKAGKSGFSESEDSDFEYEALTSRETLFMVRAYRRIPDPMVRKRIFELIKSLAEGKPDPAAGDGE